MTWYAAHTVMYIKFKDGNQNSYPVWENIILIQAENDEQAYLKAEQRAKKDEGDSQNTFTHNNRPATWVFAGIRRLVECVNSNQQPTNGTEITYLELEIDTAEQFKQFINGEPSPVLYEG